MNIGISGPIGAGKTTAAVYFASTYGLYYLRYSEVLAEMSPEATSCRQSLREFGWTIMSGGMQSTLNQKLLTKMQTGVDYVIDGVRHPIDLETLSARPPFYLFYIDASPQIRWQRVSSREESMTWEEFVTIEKHPVESRLSFLKEKAYKTLLNEGPLTEFHAILDAVFAEMRNSEKQ